MARISVEDEKSEDLMNRAKNLTNRIEKSRVETNTQAFQTGLDVEESLQEIKEVIVNMSQELSEDMNYYREKIQEQYDCTITRPQRGIINIEMHGQNYDYRIGEEEIALVDGESLQSKHCPECGSQEHNTVNFEKSEKDIENFEKTEKAEESLEERRKQEQDEDFDGIKTSKIFKHCEDCGVIFERVERRDKFDEEKLEEANKVGTIYRRAFTEAHGTLVDYIEHFLGDGRGTWVTETTYSYTTGMLVLEMPTLPKKTEHISVRVELPDTDIADRPYNQNVRMWRGFSSENERFPEDYRKLLDEIATLNSCRVKILGYKLNYENPQILALMPREKSRNISQSLPESDPITPVNGQGYTVKPIEKQAVQEYFESKFEDDARVEREMEKYEDAEFLEIQEDMEVKNQ